MRLLDPFRRLDLLAEFDPLFDVSRWDAPLDSRPRWQPVGIPLEVRRHEDSFVAFFDLPGVSPDAIDVVVDRDTLTVTARREAQETGNVLIDERPRGTFTRSVRLADHLNAGGVVAEYRDGVLEVVIPLDERSRARKIAVGAPQGTAVLAGAHIEDQDSGPVGHDGVFADATLESLVAETAPISG